MPWFQKSWYLAQDLGVAIASTVLVHLPSDHRKHRRSVILPRYEEAVILHQSVGLTGACHEAASHLSKLTTELSLPAPLQFCCLAQYSAVTMYDFCFSPIYATLLAVGGIAGFAAKGSTESLLAGIVAAGILAVCSYLSLLSYHAGKTCKPATALSLIVAGSLTFVMYNRYVETRKLMPAGITAGLSAVMTAFYIWSLFLGPQPTPKPAAKAQ